MMASVNLLPEVSGTLESDTDDSRTMMLLAPRENTNEISN